MTVPMDVDSGGTLEKGGGAFEQPHRKSVKAKSNEAVQMRKARIQEARKASRVISRMTSQGRDREEVVFQIMEGKRELRTLPEIDSDVFSRIAANICIATNKSSIQPDLQTKIVQQIIGKRRQALDKICQNQEIRDLYHAIYGTALPSKDALPQVPDSEISALVFSLAKSIKEWNTLPDSFKQLYEPVEVRAIYDDPEQLERILEAATSYKLFIQARASGLISEVPVFKAREEVQVKAKEIASLMAQSPQAVFAAQETVVSNAMNKLRLLEVTVSPSLRGLFETTKEKGMNLLSLECPEAQAATAFLPFFQKNCQNFQEQVDKFETAVIEDIQKDLGIERALAEQIFRGAQENWKNFIEIMPDGIVKQKHNIKGLKIYMLPGTSQLVADYGQKEIGKGGFKSAKSFYRLGGLEGVRLHDPKEWWPPEVFIDDMKAELNARIVLTDVPNIASITVVQYYNKEDVLKTRYIMTKYEKDLSSLISNPKDKEKALECCKGVFRSLVGLNQRGYVHGDL
jgi:hypothetical protein